MIIYRPVIAGEFTWYVTEKEGHQLLVNIPVPIDFFSAEAAEKASFVANFEKRKNEDDVVLCVYQYVLIGQHVPTQEDRWEKRLVEIIHWEEYDKYRNFAMRTLAGFDEPMLPDATPWNELFDEKSKSDGCVWNLSTICIDVDAYLDFGVSYSEEREYAALCDYWKYVIEELIANTKHYFREDTSLSQLPLLYELKEGKNNYLGAVVDQIVKEGFPIGGYCVQYVSEIDEDTRLQMEYTFPIDGYSHAVDLEFLAPLEEDVRMFRLLVSDDPVLPVKPVKFDSNTCRFSEVSSIREALIPLPEI